MLTDPDAAYLRRIADAFLPGKHRDRAYTIASDIELVLTRVEDSLWTIDHADAAPEQKLAEVRELLSQCLVAEDTRVESEETAPGAGAVGRYVKRPVTVEAIRYDGTVASSIIILDWIGASAPDGRADNKGGVLTIRTLEGDMVASPGDYIIRGVQGEFYPCKPDIFDATYQPASPQEA
ncbi:hypothetical protein [Actinomyces procaprae]|uniref:hypothetical protein n=1 Tax=Actinomyces procaprae TaxID=2560010 RepID=UPI0019585F29|nr:hypothetical protein [Actinomyces procaprae]